MCILFIAVHQHESYPLIIAANRDEFYARPTAPSAFWNDYPDLLAGKDLQAGGSWMGITRQGQIAALTNIRNPQLVDKLATTRGKLVTDYLQRPIAADYLCTLKRDSQQYNGFNLLFGQWHNLHVFNNHTRQTSQLTSGVYGLSNASLNSPWPKAANGMQQLAAYCATSEVIEAEQLFALLKNNHQAADHELPDTGVPLEWERKLSSIFIQSPEYGTRSSTLLLIDQQQKVNWQERTFDTAGLCVSQQNYSFDLI